MINLSLGGPGSDPSISNAVDVANSSNAVVVAAAGNESLNNDEFPEAPCVLPQANLICVASIDNNGLRSGFSNYGPRPSTWALPEEASAAPREPTRPPTSSWTAPPWPRRMSPASPRSCGAGSGRARHRDRPGHQAERAPAPVAGGRHQHGRPRRLRGRHPAGARPSDQAGRGAPRAHAARQGELQALQALDPCEPHGALPVQLHRGRRPQGQDHTEDGEAGPSAQPRPQADRHLRQQDVHRPGERQGHGPVQALPPQPPHLEALQAAADLGGGEAPQLGEPHPPPPGCGSRCEHRVHRGADPLGRPLRRLLVQPRPAAAAQLLAQAPSRTASSSSSGTTPGSVFWRTSPRTNCSNRKR